MTGTLCGGFWDILLDCLQKIKNKLLLTLLAFVMAAALPMIFATPAEAATTVDVGGGTYGALMDAANSATASTTLRLTKDISITSNNNVWIAGKSFTLDLNGHSITSTQNDALYIINSSNVKIINSSTTRATITGSIAGLEVLSSSTVRIEGAITINKLLVGSAVYVDDPQVTVSSFNNKASKNNTHYYQYSVSSWDELKHAADLAPKDGTAATITLTADIPAANQFLGIGSNQNITLDLNGHNITSTQENSAIYKYGNSNLTITNSSSTRSTITGNGRGAIWALNTGSIRIQGAVTLNNMYVYSNSNNVYVDDPNVVISACWDNTTKNNLNYKVFYNANGGVNPPAANYKKGSSNLNLSSTAPTRSGYTLKGWNTAANGNGTNYGFTYNTNAVTTLYAQWSQNQNLTYNANGHGTAPATVTMTYNTATNAADAITAEGYTFSKWTTAANGSGTAYVAKAQIKAANVDPTATTLYARWTANKYTIAYNANGGDTTPASTEATYDVNATLAAAPTRAGYTFIGWNTVQEGTGTSYASGASVSNLTAENNGIVTLYAQWTENTAALTYDANGHGTAPDAVTMKTTAATNAAAAISATGYTFNGWNTAADGTGTAYAAGAEFKGANVNPTETTLYAQWTGNYTVSAAAPDGVTMFNGVQSVKKDDGTADMRFFWTINFNDAERPTSLGAYFFDWTVFDLFSTDKATEAANAAKEPSVQKSITNELEDGSIFYGTITNITEFGRNYYALPIVNNKLFAEAILQGSVNGTDINQQSGGEAE